jgi:uncharacterized protein (DUF488 family)
MRAAESWNGSLIHTLGHSTRTLENLVQVLESFEIDVLADIRTVPRSRHNPQFNVDSLPLALRPLGIHYAHLPKLGGLRRARQDSINTGWRNSSFRGYADYMQTEAFEAGLLELHELLARGRVALMCAEAVPWRCHRSLVADVLLARGAQVEHISGPARSKPHVMTSFAEVRGSCITYPGERA